MSKHNSGFKFRERTKEIPLDHFEIVNITTDDGVNICVNFDERQAPLFERRHITIMLAALEDAFYRLRHDLREQ